MKKRSKHDLIWKCSDYKGRTVCLYVQERDHIANDHPIMGNNFHAISNTIQYPDSVYKSSNALSDNREVYFKADSTASYSAKFMTKVIVEYTEDNSGHVVTAFPRPDERGGISDKIYP